MKAHPYLAASVRAMRLVLLKRLTLLVPLTLAFAPVAVVALSPAQSDALYQELLRDPKFKAADKELSAAYSAVRKQMNPAAQSLIRDQQREWLKATYEAIANAAPAARAGLGTRLTQERARELRGGAPSVQPMSPSSLPVVRGKGMATTPQGESIDVEANLAKLQSRDPDARLEALRVLEYSLDPRIPAVMLGLLNDAGNTTRRVAAHGIGSRWWQIPKDRLEVYIARLKKAAVMDLDGAKDTYTGDFHRSIALLQQAMGKRMEHPEAVSVSPNGRWIVYDRFGLPCLVDVETQSEELLGLGSREGEGRFGTFGSEVVWHPSKETVAIPLHTRRGTASVVVWAHGSGTQVVHRDRMLELITKRKFKPNGMMSFISEEELKWKGDRLLLTMNFETEGSDGNGPEHVATASWNPANGSIVLESIK